MELLNTCPVCKGNQFQPYISCVDHTVSHETFNIAQCNNCNFRFTNPIPFDNESGKYYLAEEYISHSGSTKGLVNKLYGIVKNYTIHKKVNLVNKQMNNATVQSKSLLDIGCGTGDFLFACKQKGWNVTGIEPSSLARSNAERKFGIIPLNSNKLFELVDIKFQVITLWHVLEHIYELDKTIMQIKSLLDKDGTLIVAVPNCNSWDAKKYGQYWAAWDVPRHLYHFKKSDIETLFSKYKFNIAEILPMKFDSFYVSLLSEKYKFGKIKLIPGFINGLRSNIFAAQEKYGYSSQIYILKTT